MTGKGQGECRFWLGCAGLARLSLSASCAFRYASKTGKGKDIAMERPQGLCTFFNKTGLSNFLFFTCQDLTIPTSSPLRLCTMAGYHASVHFVDVALFRNLQTWPLLSIQARPFEGGDMSWRTYSQGLHKATGDLLAVARPPAQQSTALHTLPLRQLPFRKGMLLRSLRQGQT